MKGCLPALLTSLIFLHSSCSKEDTGEKYVIQVTDYVSNSPIEQVHVHRSTRPFLLSCWCYDNYQTGSLGSSNSEGLIYTVGGTDNIFLKKEGYSLASVDYSRVLEKTGNWWHFRMFREAYLDITYNPPSPLPGAYIEVWPVLHNGSFPSMKAYNIRMSPGSTLLVQAYGDLRNKVLVLRNSGTSVPDTLNRYELFVAAGWIDQLNVSY